MDLEDEAMILQTGRLILREFVAEDWPAVMAYQSDPQYLRYYEWVERTEEEVQAFVQRFLDWQVEKPRLKYQFAITLPGEARPIGNCGVRLGEVGAQIGELGYEIAPRHWGRGYATEAAGAIMRFGFEELGLHRIWGQTVAENVASQQVMKKLGMRAEGCLREAQWYKGRWWDTVIYGILDTEWREVR